MKPTSQQLWERFQTYYTEYPSIELAIDLSRMSFNDQFFPSMEPRLQKAFAAMEALEKGAIANPDENRRVGHYWLRNPSLAPTPEIRTAIEEALRTIQEFARQVHLGEIRGARGAFRYLLLIGIGGSALGPQFVASALGHPKTDKMAIFFLDNTDPDGIDRVMAQIPDLGKTLSLVISKSGGTKETRNGMLEAKAAYEKAGLTFESHAVAITGQDSALDQVAQNERWLARFPMWDWVGGRTSVLSAVGLLPAALQGLDIHDLLKGAADCDILTRLPDAKKNPAAQLALMWHHAGNAKGDKDMVILPYKDRLELFSRYLQQLIMESLGKEKDLSGNVVNQGISVYGNKGSTDQHAYIQQLRDGTNNFFATFIEVLEDSSSTPIEVEPEITSGDFLHGFFLGTRQALHENGRESLTLTIKTVSSFSVGVLIALFERAVGLYAVLININAYHQPGVEAGKKAAAAIIALELQILKHLRANPGTAKTALQIAQEIDCASQVESVFKICEHLAANPFRRIARHLEKSPFESRYSFA